ncbi:hypothetical protein BGZ92_001224 [Podila epicladia]|nr:hypothetical protein BGZ92_001224 [Podila epicladia]
MDSTPIYTPHSTVNYGATGNNPSSPVPLYTIFVIHNGHQGTVNDQYPADKLKLVGVSIRDDPSKGYEKICLKHLAQKRPLRATEVLEDLFLGQLPERGQIHVVIETDEPKSSFEIVCVPEN